MKTNLICTSIAAVLAAVTVNAQSSPVLKANVPFDFVAGSQTMAAGAYTVGYTASGVVVIQSTDRKGAVMSLATPLDGPFGADKARLVFHRCGNIYFLVEVWGPENGRQLPTTSREREMAARVGRSNASIVAALR
jgi:hypothetical protein